MVKPRLALYKYKAMTEAPAEHKLNAERRAAAGNRRLARFQMHLRSVRTDQCITFGKNV